MTQCRHQKLDWPPGSYSSQNKKNCHLVLTGSKVNNFLILNCYPRYTKNQSRREPTYSFSFYLKYAINTMYISDVICSVPYTSLHTTGIFNSLEHCLSITSMTKLNTGRTQTPYLLCSSHNLTLASVKCEKDLRKLARYW